MIKETFIRFKDGTKYEYTNDKTAEKAFESLFRGELEFGTNIIDITTTTVCCETHIMSCVDTTIWSGSETDMKPLVEAAMIYLYLCTEHGKMLTDKLIDKVMDITMGIPLHVKLAAGMVMGEGRSNATLLAMLGEEVFEKAQSLKNNDLCTVVVLNRFHSVPLKEAIELAL